MLGFHGISVAPISALAGNDVTMSIATAASVTAAGQDVLAIIGLVISTAASISSAGQTVLATLGMAISTSAMVTAAGQDVSLRPRSSTGPLFMRKIGGKTAVYWRGRTT